MEIPEEQIQQGLDKAYEKAGNNAYFGNGFEAGVKFAQEAKPQKQYPIKLELFQGHIILLCKQHYQCKDFFEALARLWVVRCGYDYEHTSSDVFIYIANDMYRIIAKTEPNRLPHLMEQLHKEVGNQAFYKPENMTPIQAIIWEYRSILCNLKIREGNQILVELPTPQKDIFKRIFEGRSNYQDYELLKNQEKFAKLKKVS